MCQAMSLTLKIYIDKLTNKYFKLYFQVFFILVISTFLILTLDTKDP